MDPKQFEIFLERNERATADAINKYVNGKIDRLNNKLDPAHADYILKDIHDHMDEVKPIIEAYSAGKTLGNFIKWLGGIIITAAAAWALIFKQ